MFSRFFGPLAFAVILLALYVFAISPLVSAAFGQAAGSVATAPPPDLPPDATALLTSLGLGKYTAAIASILAVLVFVVAHLLPFLPPPAIGAKGFWPTVYAILNFIAGNYRNAVSAAAKPALAFLLATSMLLTACGDPITPAQKAALTNVVVTLASIAAQKNATVADLVTRGALFCQYVNPLSLGGVVAIANAAGVPVSVTDQSKKAVDDTCGAIAAVAVSPPPAPEAVPVVPVAITKLPPTS